MQKISHKILVLFLLCFGCSSVTSTIKDPVTTKHSLQVDRILNNPEAPHLADPSSEAERICIKQGGRIIGLNHSSFNCQLDNETIFSYYIIPISSDESKIVGMRVFFHHDNGSLLQLATQKFGQPTLWKDNVASWYNENNGVVMSIESHDKITIISFYIAAAFM